MSQIKISTEIKIDSVEGQSISGDTAKESTNKSTKKNSFEEVLKKISELKKGKTFAAQNEVSNFQSQLSEKKDSKIEKLVNERGMNNTKNTIDINQKDQEESTTEKNNLLEVENEINPELQAILLGPNTQIITAKEIESNTEQLVAYAKKAGLNENAISIILNNTTKKDLSNKETIFNKTDSSTLTESVDLNKIIKNQHKPNISKAEIATQPILHDLTINQGIKHKQISKKIDVSNSSKKLEIEPNDEIDKENYKNLKMLMKTKDENFLEKLVIKKQEDEKDPSSNKVQRLQSIELGARASQFINSFISIRNSEITLSNKTYEIDQNLYSNSSINFVNKFESSTSGGHQKGANRDQLSEQIQLRRQEQFQQIAQRLGETLAKRITEQISRGAWRVQIALKPASLGSIEISLNLRGKEIEASFHASQAFTRELLAESLPKLKDSLEKSGMNVADMSIKGQNESKSGNNSTNEDDKNKEIKIDEIKTNTNEEDVNKESISNSDQTGGLNILV